VGVLHDSHPPQPIKEACLLLAARLYKRKDAIFGVSGPNEFGQLQIIDKFDADVNAVAAISETGLMVQYSRRGHADSRRMGALPGMKSAPDYPREH
jgi:hypothetical protein